MTTLFSNQALKQSLGVPSLAGIELRDRFTSAISTQPRANVAVSTSASDFQVAAKADEPLALRLYEARAQAKICMSRVAMHLSASWHQGLRRQLDSLLDIDEWLDGEMPLGTNSFATFLRLMLLTKPAVRPGLGLTSKGNLIASWQSESARLSVECQPNDQVRYVLSHEVDDRRESAAGDSSVERFLEVLAPYNPDQWLARVPTQPT